MTTLQNYFKRIVRERDGNFPMMMALLLVPMALAAGGALDFAAHERARVQLQDTLDRAVLAAAALEQTQDATALVKSYLKNIPDIANASVSVKEEQKAAWRKVSATVQLPYRPVFLRLAGIEKMTVPASSSAQEARQNIELSLVLDISGSMLDNGGMKQLIPAAKSFLDVVLGTESAKKVTSVNLIPFAGGVNLGQGAFDQLAGNSYTRRHAKSSCFELAGSDFDEGVPHWKKLDQFPHFTYYNYNVAGKQPWWCPTDLAAVTFMTNDLTLLKSKIDALKPFDGTGTAYGLKWAELLLNPDMKNELKALSKNGLASIPEEFDKRPAKFKDAETLKFIVLMSDGQVGFQRRPKDVATNEVTNKNISGDYREVFTESQALANFKKVCTYAKAEGITIFTIAFKVDATAAANISSCATDQSYAYKVDGLDMASAFESIATTMKKIRITE